MNANNIPSIAIYSTTACHLCELAEKLLSSNYPNQLYEVIEIANDEALMQRYGARIPVLYRSDNTSELNWPFTAQDIQQFLDA